MDVKPGYQQTEVGIIPEDWKITTAAEICELIVDCKNRTPPVVDGGDYAVVRTPNVRDGRFVREDLRFTDERSFREWTARTVPQSGDILITREAPLGEVCLVPNDIRVCLGQRMMLYRPDRRVADNRFLLYAVLSPGVQGNLLKKIGGSTVGHARVDDIRRLQIPLPPTKTEQVAIAEALSDADAIIESLEQLVAKRHLLKQGVMRELLIGKRRLPGSGGEWEVKQFGGLFQFLSTANNSRSDLSERGDVGYIHYGDIHTGTSAFLDCSSDRLPRIAAGKVLGIPSVNDGDLVMADASEDYDGIGKSVEIRGVNGRRVVAGLHTFLLRGDRHFIADGFKGYLQFIPSVKTDLVTLATGISVYGISKNNVRNIEVLLPPVEEQSAIAAVLSDMDAEIDALEAKLTKARQIKQGMMQELLTGRIRLV